MTEREVFIAEIQQYLRNIAKASSDVPAIIPDGIYSEETKEAIRGFQRSTGLAETGEVDFLTFDALVTENRRLLEERKQPNQVVSISNGDLPLYYGMENKLVEKLKAMLNLVADKHGNFNQLEGNALFDRDTENEVKRWQGVIFAEENGIVDKTTWNTLSDYFLLK